MTVLCCDLDGVVWLGDDPIPGAAAALVKLRRAGFAVTFVTNNSSLTPDDYAAKLRRSGVPSSGRDVLTSAQAAATMLAGELAAGARVFAWAGAGVVTALAAAGFDVVDGGQAAAVVDGGQAAAVVDGGQAAAVVVGWHQTFDFAGLRAAADAVRRGARFVATNLDPTYPIRDGLLPGNGALVAALAAAAGRPPDAVAGKPYPAMVELVRERCGEAGVVIGDRASTDGALAAALGWSFALVRSGVTRTEDAGGDADSGWAPAVPAFVADDLAGLVPQLLDAQRPSVSR